MQTQMQTRVQDAAAAARVPPPPSPPPSPPPAGALSLAGSTACSTIEAGAGAASVATANAAAAAAQPPRGCPQLGAAGAVQHPQADAGLLGARNTSASADAVVRGVVQALTSELAAAATQLQVVSAC
jgi:hypothetical protein